MEAIIKLEILKKLLQDTCEGSNSLNAIAHSLGKEYKYLYDHDHHIQIMTHAH